MRQREFYLIVENYFRSVILVVFSLQKQLFQVCVPALQLIAVRNAA